MSKQIELILSTLDNWVWGPVMLALIMGTGILLTIRFRFITIRKLPYALKLVFSKSSRKVSEGEGDISAFSALTTTLAATIGTGNIIGVATAMVLGGPGALVWMWISAIVGMASKFAECMLAVRYRQYNAKHEMSGGPMYYITEAFKNKRIASVLSRCFALFTVFASFGIGNMTQANAIAESAGKIFFVDSKITGIIVMLLTFVIVVGGIKKIARISEILVPFMALLYVAAALIVIIGNINNLWDAIVSIFSSAFSCKAYIGGMGGTIIVTMMTSLRWGVSRGVFSNEAGLGSAAISAAAATTNDPVKQGLINMTAVFFDTIVICTLTGLAIATSGMLGAIDESGELVSGVKLTILCFGTMLGKWSGFVISIGIIMFAFSTIVSWEYYGEKALEYLIKNPKYCIIYRVVFSSLVFIGATNTLSLVWNFSDIMNGLMAIPNLLAIIALSKVVSDELNMK